MVFRFFVIFGLLFNTVIGFAQKNKEKPNVIVILTDDQGYGDITAHGNPFIQTPALDKLHSESVSFSGFHVDPTCAPTRAALMTGRYSARVGVWMTYMGRHHLAKEEITMADVFKENGYDTAIFGKWHLGDNYPFRPMDRGFKESLIHGGGVIGETPDYWGNDYYDDTYFRNGKPEKVSGYATDVWFNETKAFIKKSIKDSKPFFVYLPLNAPHGPYHVPEKYAKPYLNKKGIPKSRALFYGMIANIDENMANFRTFLKDNNLSDNTILVFMTDNGTSGGSAQKVVKKENIFEVKNISGFNAGMRGKKGMVYEGGHRAICMLYWPNAKLSKKQNISKLTAHIDILPTLIDLADLRLKKKIKFDGKSLAPLLNKKTQNPWETRSLVVHDQTRFKTKIIDDRPIKYKEYAVMTEKWRLVGEELYDVVNDPGQTVDISENNKDVVEELMESYENWWTDISENFNTYNRTIVGSTYQKEVQLSAQFWHGNYAPYNQQHVRSALQTNGFWDLEIAVEETYEIELRRWPKELNLAIDALVKAPVLDPKKQDIAARLVNLKTSSIIPTSARLQIGGFDQIKPVKKGQKTVVFEVKLPKGKVNLKTWFINNKGEKWGAYYVYINIK